MQNSRRFFTAVPKLRQTTTGGVESNHTLPKTGPQPIGADLLKSIGGGKRFTPAPQNGW